MVSPPPFVQCDEINVVLPCLIRIRCDKLGKKNFLSIVQTKSEYADNLICLSDRECFAVCLVHFAIQCSPVHAKHFGERLNIHAALRHRALQLVNINQPVTPFPVAYHATTRIVKQRVVFVNTFFAFNAIIYCDYAKTVIVSKCRKEVKIVNIGERIRSRRQALNLSVDELAARLGKNRATVYRYENNEIENLPLSVLEPLAKALQTSPTYLIGWAQDADNAPPWQSREEFMYEQQQDESNRLSDFMQNMKKVYHQLNTAGQEHLLQTAKDMTQIERFRKGTTSQKGKAIS